MQNSPRSPQPLPPGLLLILRQAAWLRGALIALGVVLYLALYPELGALPLLLAIGAERAAFIALVSWNALRAKLGAHFLPLALGWLFLTPVLEIAFAFLARDDTLRVLGLQADVLGLSSPLIWLVVPTVLSAWQYGRRGLFFALAILVGEHLALGVALWTGVPFGVSYSLGAAGRIAMLAVLGYAGACGYLLKDSDSAEIVRAVRGAVGGETWIDPAIAGRVLAEFNRLAAQRLSPLRGGAGERLNR